MALFNKRKDDKLEIDYLQTIDTVGRPTAALFSIIMVVVLAAAVFSLFLGGRWLYQHLDGSDQPTTEVVVNPVTVVPPSASSTSNNGATGSSGTNSSAGSSSTTSSTQQSGTASSTQTSTSIPATGPTEITLLFALTVVVATFSHYAWQRKRS